MSITYTYEKNPDNEKFMVITSTEIKDMNVSLTALKEKKAKLEHDKQIAIDAYDGRLSEVQNKIDQAIALGIKEDLTGG